MDSAYATEPNTASRSSFGIEQKAAGILLAFSPAQSASVDRCVISGRFTVGRAPNCHLTVEDSKISSRHFCIDAENEHYELEDLKSTNGTYVNGLAVKGREALKDRSVIRAGRSIFVFHEDVTPFLNATPAQRFGMAGRFHSGSILDGLRHASLSSRFVLLSGPSGTGKELAARALFEMMNEREKLSKLLTHNCARFASQEEAEATLFGVSKRFFSNVDARPGLIEQANGGALFLDEVHNMTTPIQRSLLRAIENGEVSRLGEAETRQVNVKFILATNASGTTRGLAHDLFARLRLVEIPPLKERLADIPTIFKSVFDRFHTDVLQNPIDLSEALTADHYEALLLDAFPETNVRGLVDLADRIFTEIAAGSPPPMAIANVFHDGFASSVVALRKPSTKSTLVHSRYEQNKALIVTAFENCDKNLSATERKLKSIGLKCSRRWLSVFLKKWGCL